MGVAWDRLAAPVRGDLLPRARHRDDPRIFVPDLAAPLPLFA